MTAASARTPFLNFDSFSVGETGQPAPPPPETVSERSPFLSVYELPDGESTGDDPTREAYAALVEELYDDELDEALFELQDRGRALHDEQLALGRSRPEADQLVRQHFTPLMDAAEAVVDTMAQELTRSEDAGAVDHEVDAFVEGYVSPHHLQPEFEDFLGKWAKKIGRAAKGVGAVAVKGIKNIALGPFLALVRRAVRPFLQGVLDRAVGRLPAPLRPAAERLAQKLGFRPAAAAAPSADGAGAPPPPEAAGSPVQAAAGDDAASPQQELDDHLAAALLAGDEVELELEAARWSNPSGATSAPVFAELDDARERLIRDLEALGPDDSAAPHIQNFLPALLQGMRLGVRLVGRPRVVDYLGSALAKLVSKLIGPQHAPALGKAIADAGLRLMTLEMTEAEAARVGPAAVASTIEETISRVASLPEEVLDDRELLEGFVLEAFEQAAAANLPAVFAEETYRRRPDLLEAGVDAGWVLLPLRGPKRYKRCTRNFSVSLSPQMAAEVEAFDGSVLAEHLQDQLGLDEGETLEAQLHLYESLPGTTVADIARGERETIGPGLSDEANTTQLHPLVPQAAAVLMGRPGLGRPLPLGAAGRHLPSGTRLYHVAAGRRPLPAPGAAGRSRPRRLLRVDVTIDGVQDQLRVSVFLSEVRAQRLATRLRQATNLGLVVATFRRSLAGRLSRILRGEAPARLRVIHAAMRPGRVPAMQNLSPAAQQAFLVATQGWLTRALSEFLKAQSRQVIAASEDPADGITFLFTVEHPPGLTALGQTLTGSGSSPGAITAAIASGAAPTTRVEVVAGYRRG